MATITVEREGAVGAPAELTYRLIADDTHHQRFLLGLRGARGGVGAGTVHRFKVTAGGRTREYVMRRMYADELARLDGYAREQAATAAT